MSDGNEDPRRLKPAARSGQRLWAECLVAVLVILPVTVRAGVPEGVSPPTWAVDARWYRIDVPCLDRNTPSAAAEAGGTSAELRKALSRARELEFNAVILSGVLVRAPGPETPAGSRLRANPTLFDAGAASPQSDEYPDGFAPAERALLDVVREAHRLGLRIVFSLSAGLAMEGPDSGNADVLVAETRTWFDPNGDGDPKDGVDGWFWTDTAKVPDETWKEWHAAVKKLNVDALLISEDDRSGESPGLQGIFDGHVERGIGAAVKQLIVAREEGFTPVEFWKALEEMSCDSAASPASLPTLEPGAQADLGKLLPRMRLALAFQFLYKQPPMLIRGYEFGNFERPAVGSCRSEWRLGQGEESEGDDSAARQRMEFAQLVHLFNTQRAEREILRRGEVRPILLKESDHVLAFSRSLKGRQIIVLINCGDRPTRAKLDLKTPRRLLGILTPQLVTHPQAARLPGRAAVAGRLLVMGARQYTDRTGALDLALDAMSVRLVLVD
ncbi:MAG: hypothetical protein J5J06_08780 [Phycisphaerae bacterium]|nr:hypothetical protein [Phycisphaerae bacterium]